MTQTDILFSISAISRPLESRRWNSDGPTTQVSSNVFFVSCFLLSSSSYLFIPLYNFFYWQLCFLSHVSCPFWSSSTFISGNRSENSAQRGKKIRGKSKKQEAHCRWAFGFSVSRRLGRRQASLGDICETRPQKPGRFHMLLKVRSTTRVTTDKAARASRPFTVQLIAQYAGNRWFAAIGWAAAIEVPRGASTCGRRSRIHAENVVPRASARRPYSSLAHPFSNDKQDLRATFENR